MADTLAQTEKDTVDNLFEKISALKAEASHHVLVKPRTTDGAEKSDDSGYSTSDYSSEEDMDGANANEDGLTVDDGAAKRSRSRSRSTSSQKGPKTPMR
ncbi:hypothetical protein HK104_007677, partial [Borealophlyctis nickersoniae]